MICFPNSKINLGLHITSKRPDGFHNLESVFYPVDLTDALEIIVGGNQSISMTFSGLEVPGKLEENLSYKAWQLLKKDFKIPNLKIHLHKVIPIGAGLGGGSSDGVSTLKLINSICDLGIDNYKLFHYASQLGSDCAFFVENKPAIATGRGDELHSVDLNLKGKYCVLIMPSLTVGTAEAYSWISPKKPKHDLMSVIKKPIHQWKEFLVNDFEEPVFKHRLLIKEIKFLLYQKGAIYASMSGSGSAIYGIFDSKPLSTEFENSGRVFITSL